MKVRARTTIIRNHILHLCRDKVPNVSSEAAHHFGITKQAAARHLQILEAEGLVSSTRRGKDKLSTLNPIVHKVWSFPKEGLREDIVWRDKVLPELKDLPENVMDIWHYGVTEMVNNAIDHSEGTEVAIYLERTALDATVWVTDNGEGIFHRIQRLLELYDAREAILELVKGKLTTDPEHHTGEGIFFTSRAFDRFAILSRNLNFIHRQDKKDWLIDDDVDLPGTRVFLTLDNDCARTIKSVLDEFAAPDEFSFSKTIVPVRLAKHEGEKLVSRSQAKRLVARFEKFKTVVLDFDGVAEIGQGFADEIFRVFAKSHPIVDLIPINMTDAVQAMISRALASA